MLTRPAGTNAGRYVALIAEGRFEEAYRYARDPNPLASICGRVCAHPCETACRRGEIDSPIQIRALKRLLTERYGPEARRPLRLDRPRLSPQPFRVAVVGAGPVGLSAAHDLGLLGYSVTIFDAAPVAGGMMVLGIPEYRLPRNVVDAQVREILESGDITLKLNHAAGRDFTISGLREQGFAAVVIAVGAHRSRDLSIPGVDLDGVHKGIDFLLNANLGYRFTIGKKVVVIGGGNVAMDVARSAAREVVKRHASGLEGLAPSETNVAAVATHEMVDVSLSALRLGAQEVDIVCLEKRHEMPAALEEIEEAEAEGIILHDGFGPRRVVGRDGKVLGLEVVRTKAVFDASGRFNPTFFENSEQIIGCDTVILAIGQSPNLDFLKPEDGVRVSPRGLIVADPGTLMTTAAGVFAGGDCVFGPRLIIDSVGDGKRIAIAVDEYRGAGSPPDGRRLHGSQPASGPDAAARTPHRRHRSRDRLRRADRHAGSPAVPSLLDQHGLRGQPDGRFPMRSVRRVHRRLSRAVHPFGAARADRVVARSAGGNPPERATLPRGTRRRCRGRVGLDHGLGDAQGRDSVHPLRHVRRKVPCQGHHHGSLLCGPE
jgi:NADPH-dependent glutamate synthase beta subunit-like oxidoreductase